MSPPRRRNATPDPVLVPNPETMHAASQAVREAGRPQSLVDHRLSAEPMLEMIRLPPPNPSTPQSSRSASLIQEAGRERSMSLPLRGRAPAAQEQQRTQPLSSQREDQNGKSEPPLPDDQDHDHPLPDAHHQDTEADTDSHLYREVCLDQEANDEFQRIVQGKDTLISRPKSLRELRDEEVFHTAREELATPEEVKGSNATSRLPPSESDVKVEGSVSATAIVPRAKKGRQRPNLKLNTQVNQSFIASSVTSGSGDKLMIAPTLESWANRSQISWVEVCDARAVTIANHPISSVHRVHRDKARSSRIEEKHEEEDEGDKGDERHEERGRQQPEREPLASATEAPDDGGRRSRRRSEVHWIDKPPQVKASTPPRRSHTTKERGPRRVYDEESIPSRHSIQVDSQHRLSTGSAAEMAERDVGSPLEYLRRSFRRDSRRASWGGNTDDASSIARHIEQTKRRLEGQPSPPGKPHAHVSDPRAIRAARTARAAQNHEDHKETLWKRMGRKGLQVLKFGRTGSHQEKKAESEGDETPVRPTARQRTNSGFGSLIRRVSSRRSRRDKAEQAPRADAASAAVPAATPTPGARPGRATTGEAGEREERFERQPRSYRQRLQRSLSRASRKLRRRPQEQPRL
ncbi:hypothetical protein KEM56_005120 [Ascosphaera pollenicola]|nr:hypothetical protein KEM56_005120 [Ascosphaera pollenicola]